MDLYTLLCELLEKHGPSGDETPIASYIMTEAKKYCDDVSTDVMGNVIVHKKGNGPKIMFSAHMDSIGFIATHFDEEGYVRVARLGGVDPREVLYGQVKFKNNTCGIVVKDEKAQFKTLKMDEIVIDIGASSKEEAMEKVMLGDTAVLTVPPMKLEGKETSIVSPYLDNRVSCGILLAVLEQLKDKTPVNDLYFVFSSQEEVGLRGAKPAAYEIDPAYGLAIDVTDVCDNPDTEKNGTTVLGGGAGIKIMDRSVISHPEVVEVLEKLATEQNIKQQRDILKLGGTDAGVIHTSRGGVKTGGISVPCRYVHSPSEMANLSDIEACIALTFAFAQCKLNP